MRYRKLTDVSSFQSILSASLTDSEYIVFDIETTGGNPERNGLTEFCGLKIKNGEVVDTFETLINPEIPIPPIVRKMTGINDKMVRNSPKVEEVMHAIIDFIGDRIVISHNTIGDLKFIRYFCEKVCGHMFENFFICTHLLSERYLSDSPDKSLKGLAKYLEFDFEGAHRAQADAVFTWQLFQEIQKRAKSDGILTVEQAIRAQGDYESSFRLGWSVPAEQVKNIPNSTGVYQGFDLKGQLIFCGSTLKAKNEIRELMQYDDLAKPMLRKVFNTYRIEFEPTSTYLDALLKEAEINHKNNLKSIGPFVNQRRLTTIYMKADGNNKYVWSVGAASSDALIALGPVFDRRVATDHLKNVADCFGLEMNKNGLSLGISESVSLYNAFLKQNGSLEKNIRRFLKSIFSFFKPSQRKFCREVLRVTENLKDFSPSIRLCDLSRVSGEISFSESSGWIRYVVINSHIVGEGEKLDDIPDNRGEKVQFDLIPVRSINSLKSVLIRKRTISSFELWEFLSWAIFSSRGRKQSVFKLRTKKIDQTLKV